MIGLEEMAEELKKKDAALEAIRRLADSKQVHDIASEALKPSTKIVRVVTMPSLSIPEGCILHNIVGMRKDGRFVNNVYINWKYTDKEVAIEYPK